MQQSRPDLNALTALQRRAKDLKAKAVYASKTLQEQSLELNGRIETAIEDRELSETRLNASRTVTRTVGQFDAFENAITAFATADVDSSHAEHWANLPDMLLRMQRDQSWVKLFYDPVVVNAKEVSAEQIDTWLRRASESKKQSGSELHFLFRQMKDTIAFLTAAAEQPQAIEKLKTFAQSDLLKTTYVYTDVDPDRTRENEPVAMYYSPKSYEAGSPPHNVNYYADYTLALREKNFGATRYKQMQGLEAGHSVS